MEQRSKLAKILVADDEQDMRVLLSTLLSNVGYDVSEAADGLAATKMACQERPDVILLDVSMPGVGGLEVLKWLRGNPVTRSIPVILVTAMPILKTDYDPVGRFGYTFFITKPWRRGAIELAVKRALAGKRRR